MGPRDETASRDLHDPRPTAPWTGRLDEATREPRMAVAPAPRTGLLVEFAGLLALRRGRYEEALTAPGAAVTLVSDPTRLAVVLNDNGASLAGHGRPRDAEPLVRKAVHLDPLVQARRNLVLILMDQRRTDEARESRRLAVDATGNRPEYSDLDRQRAAN